MAKMAKMGGDNMKGTHYGNDALAATRSDLCCNIKDDRNGLPLK